MGRGASKAGGGTARGENVNDIIDSGSFKGVSRNVLKKAVDNNVESLMASLNNKYAQGKNFSMGGKEYTVTKGASFSIDDSNRVTISFTGERQTKTENISREYNAILLSGDGVNASKMGFISHKDTRAPLKKKK